MRNLAMLLSAAALVAITPAMSQDKPATRPVYKVEFTIRDGSQAARHYGMLVEADGRSLFRLGNKVPYIVGGAQANSGAQANTQYNYADIGVNIDCRLRELNGQLSMTANLELSSVVQPAPGAGGAPNPTIASTRIEVTTGLERGKPVLISTVDDPVTQRKLDIEAVATRIN